jgi:hypothetical protein
MARIIRLTENDLARIVRRVIREDEEGGGIKSAAKKMVKDAQKASEKKIKDDSSAEKNGGFDIYSKIYQYLEEKCKNSGDLHSSKTYIGNQPRPRWLLSWNCKAPFYSSPDESKEWAAYIEPSYIDNSSGKVNGAKLFLFIKKIPVIQDKVTELLGPPVKKNVQIDFASRKYDGLMFILKTQDDAQTAAYVISQVLKLNYYK